MLQCTDILIHAVNMLCKAILSNVAEKLGFKNELALLVFFGSFIRLVVLPTHRLFTLFTRNISDNMSTCSHVSLARLSGINIDYIIKKVSFPVLATKVLPMLVS
jgi:hypothetical protein